MGPLGIRPPTEVYDDLYFLYANSRYLYSAPYYRIGYVTSETVLAWIAVRISHFTDKIGGFDIRVLGGVNAGLFLIAVTLAFHPRLRPPPILRPLLAIGLFLMFLDVAYVAAFNSFYSATASYLGLVLIAAIFFHGVHSSTRPVMLVPALWLGALLFVTSKPQEAPLAPLLAVLGARWTRALFPHWKRKSLVAGAALCVVAFLQYALVPRELGDAAIHHAVFLEMLPNSPTPGRDLEELGLPRTWTRYGGTSAYSEDSPFRDPAFRRELTKHVGHVRIAGFYAFHPARLFDLLHRAASFATVTRPWHLGNFDKSAGFPPRAKSQAFAIWSDLKMRVAPWGPWLLLVNVTAAAAVGAAAWRRAPNGTTRFAAEAHLALLVAFLFEFLIGVVGEGISDLVRHLYAFHVMFDLLLLSNLAFAVALFRGKDGGRAGPISTVHQ